MEAAIDTCPFLETSSGTVDKGASSGTAAGVVEKVDEGAALRFALATALTSVVHGLFYLKDSTLHPLWEMPISQTMYKGTVVAFDLPVWALVSSIANTSNALPHWA